jgi:hypothetical protein
MMAVERIDIIGSMVHAVWCNWMEYLFTKGKFNDDGSFTIDAEAVARWKLQMKTNYFCLPVSERQSDRDIAIKYMNLIEDLM